MGYNSKYTGAEIENLLEGAGVAHDKSLQASVDAAEALRQAQVATDSIATLKGLENSDEVMAEIAKEIVQITQNTSDIASIKQSTVYLTRAQYDEYVVNGTISDNVEYNIFEE